MGFRFPPHSIYADSIDLFTFLPTVLESRRGVCLGVSTLYLALSQRLALPLESVTPPGHIFLRSIDNAKEINIETTMRGVHIHSDEYLGLNTKKLKTRTMREVIGMSYVNQASIFLAAGKWEEAAHTYEKAYPFMPNDPLVQELLGSSYLFVGKEKEGRKLLAQAQKASSDDTVNQDRLIDDILEGKVDAANLKPYFMHVDETRKSIEAKRDALIKACKRYPKFRSGLFQIAALQLQLKKPKEAIEYLEKLSALDKSNLTCEYYLAALFHDRYNEPKAIQHLNAAEKIAGDLNYYPRQLLELKVALSCSK
jgi:tetratricopeptide (TPR) repeat protein